MDLDRFYESYMIVKYGIESYNGGCIVMENEDCYSDEMDRIITNKFGVDFFKNAEGEVEKEFEKFKALGLEERKRYIDFEYTYRLGMTDTRADYQKDIKSCTKKFGRE